MSELLWTCENGAVFSSQANGLRLLVAPSPSGGGFRYQLLTEALAERRVPLASGHRDDLRDAIEAAERTARGFARPYPRH